MVANNEVDAERGSVVNFLDSLDTAIQYDDQFYASVGCEIYPFF